MDGMDKMEYTYLPEKEAFYSSLTLTGISDADYNHAQNVWKTFSMETMGDYHDLYLKTDVLLLADCFENFRKTCIQNYDLDPAHYYTTPGLSWDSALKMTRVNLELLGDIDMHLMIEKGNLCFLFRNKIIQFNVVPSVNFIFALGVRGGVSTITTRYCRANNKYLSWYDPNKKMVYLLDLDANNLYGKPCINLISHDITKKNNVDTHGLMNFNINRLGHESTPSHRWF